MRLSFNLSHKAKIQNPVFENEPSELSAVSEKKCKRTRFCFFFLHSISSKITVVKEKAGKKRKSEKEKRRRTEYINLWLNS